MDEILIKKLFIHYKKLSLRMGFNFQAAEDIAQEAVMRRLQPGHETQPPKYLVLDTIRAMGLSTEKARIKPNVNHFTLELKDHMASDPGDSLIDLVEVKNRLSKMDKEQKAVSLLYLWGFSIHEISYCLSLELKRVMEILKG